MIRHVLLAAAAAVASLAAAAPASAALITLTIAGKLASGSDQNNAFGYGNLLDGADFSVVYTFDDAIGLVNEGPDYKILSGFGPDWNPGLDDSPGSAVVTINGISRAIDGDRQSQFGKTLSDRRYLDASASDYILNDLEFIYNIASFSLSGPTLFASLDLTEGFSGGVNTDGSSYIAFTRYDYITNSYSEYIQAYADLSTVTVSVPGSLVPEPAAWVMMITGFGLVGAAVRRQRRHRRGGRWLNDSAGELT